jgi:hypothetical protein
MTDDGWLAAITFSERLGCDPVKNEIGGGKDPT